jgi:hypothetical protein
VGQLSVRGRDHARIGKRGEQHIPRAPPGAACRRRRGPRARAPRRSGCPALFRLPPRLRPCRTSPQPHRPRRPRPRRPAQARARPAHARHRRRARPPTRPRRAKAARRDLGAQFG